MQWLYKQCLSLKYVNFIFWLYGIIALPNLDWRALYWNHTLLRPVCPISIVFVPSHLNYLNLCNIFETSRVMNLKHDMYMKGKVTSKLIRPSFTTLYCILSKLFPFLYAHSKNLSYYGIAPGGGQAGIQSCLELISFTLGRI